MMNDLPIIHGMSMSQILQVIGNQILVINALELKIMRLEEINQKLEQECMDAGLREAGRGGLESSDSN